MNEIENIEIKLLFEAIYERHGHDFRNYAEASIKRRIQHFVSKHPEYFESKEGRISQLISKVLYDEDIYRQLLETFSVSVSELFRDPLFFKSVREQVVPYLKAYPHIKVWHAGCASGEEVYSMAILLEEEGLYDKSTIYATDFSAKALKEAMKGVYKLDSGITFSRNYQKTGGGNSLVDFCEIHGDFLTMDKRLRRNITFTEHNLVHDQSFGEMHLIVCRNVLIYFNKNLQNRVIGLFDESLINNGFLALGSKESIRFTDYTKRMSVFDKKWKIYQKMRYAKK